jgi:hypothetical protein
MKSCTIQRANNHQIGNTRLAWIISMLILRILENVWIKTKSFFFTQEEMNLYFLDLISSCKSNIDFRRKRARFYQHIRDPRIRKGDIMRCKNNSKLLIFDGKKIREINMYSFLDSPTIPKTIRVSHYIP